MIIAINVYALFNGKGIYHPDIANAKEINRWLRSLKLNNDDLDYFIQNGYSSMDITKHIEDDQLLKISAYK